MNTSPILFIGKRGDVCCARAMEAVRVLFADAQYVVGARGEPFPETTMNWRGAYIISYLSPWIIPGTLLGQATRAAVNFHPGPPEYPGIGCTNFAVYNEETRFCVTCHHMAPRVDTGPIIAVREFSLYPEDSVWTLTQRCYAHMLVLFYHILGLIARGESLPVSERVWTRRPYKRSELEALCRITPDMSDREVARRVRAVTFPNAPGAYMEIGGHVFRHSPESPTPEKVHA